MKMNKIRMIFNIVSYWHIGSGNAEGANLDATVLKTSEGLPFIPGKTIKGLLREAVTTLEDIGKIDKNVSVSLFGTQNSQETSRYKTIPGTVIVNDATLGSQFKKWAESNREKIKMLYRFIPSTSINQDGVSTDKFLRRIEVTIPLVLFSEIEISKEAQKYQMNLYDAANLVRFIGSHRHRGLGRTKLTLKEVS